MPNNLPMLREKYAAVTGLHVAGMVFLITLLSFFAGCKPGGNGSTSTKDSTTVQTSDTSQGPAGAAIPAITGEPLYIYYTDANTMYKLIPRNNGGQIKGKIVFQYLVNSNGKLTLAGIPGKSKHQGFEVNKMVELTTSQTPVDKVTSNLFLAEQEMSEKDCNNKDDLTPVQTEILKHGSAPNNFNGYIAFVPSIVKFDNPNYKTIQYEVRWYASTADIEKISSFIAITGADLNPSPPRNAN